jgi:hypothetical protein
MTDSTDVLMSCVYQEDIGTTSESLRAAFEPVMQEPSQPPAYSSQSVKH